MPFRTRRDRDDGRFQDTPVKDEDVRIGVPGVEGYWVDQEMDSTDPEHLEVDGDGSGPSSVSGTMDSITEGTISVPHSHEARIREALIDQAEIDEATDKILRAAMPSLGLDSILARRMVPHRYTMVRAGATTPGAMVRSLFANDQRRYFLVLIEGTGDVYIGTSPGSGGNSDTFNVSGAAGVTGQAGPFWHNGEVWVGAGFSQASVSFAIVEFMAS